MAITAALVKELRQRTGAGMMACKKALQAADGDLDTAAENMRREGLAKADKKAGRVAAEGSIVSAISDDGQRAVLVEVNCETDFVGKNEDFVAFGQQVAQLVLDQTPDDLDSLNALEIDGKTVDHRRRELIAKLGENIGVRRFRVIEASAGGRIGAYLHGANIGSAVAIEGGDQELAHDLALHIAASAPAYLNQDAVPADVLEAERKLLTEQAKDSGKPDNIIEKMVEGRLRKYLAEITLLGQPFVKDPDQTIEKLLKQANATVSAYERLEVGEGIEKKEEDFAAEVQAQVDQVT